MTFNYGNSGCGCGCGSSSSCCVSDCIAPGGDPNTVQYNLNGAFSGMLNFTFDGTTVFAPSLVLNTATGGYKGPGTINATGYYLNGVPLSTGGGTTPPADPNNSMQFNNAGAFGASSMLYDATNNTFAGNGANNTISVTAANSFIANGVSNVIDTTYNEQTGDLISNFIGAGAFNTIYDQLNGGNNVIVGGYTNTIGGQFIADWANYNNLIGGGYYNSILSSVADCFANSIVGGDSNTVSGSNSFIAGGSGCAIFEGDNSFIGTGSDCNINAAGEGGGTTGCFIGAGTRNNTYDVFTFIGSGEDNISTGGYNFIGTGRGNTSNTNDAFIGAGYVNTATGPTSFIGSGNNNTVSGYNSAVVAGQYNEAYIDNSVVLGANGISRMAIPAGTAMTQVTQGTNNFYPNVGVTDKGASQTSTLVLSVSSSTGAVTKGLSFQPGTTTYIEATFVATSSYAGGQFAKFKRAAMIAFDGAVVQNLTLDTDIGSNSGSPPVGWTASMTSWYTEGVILAVNSNGTNANWVITMQMTEVIMSQV